MLDMDKITGVGVGQRIHGFAVKRVRRLEELDGELVEMLHEKTGAELVWVNRKEENKTFGVAFKTLPWNDTGVFHILEHSVLCGSDRYPVKEPFVELMKNSMNTFLNAMTFPDKTFYPISSRNDKDFLNLADVYLDAVFFPLIYSKPEIFMQEGWHYEIADDGEVSYKGVVFNEMKGVMADVDEREEIALLRAMFPDSPYGFVSGGTPEGIPELAYEDFIEAHKRFYSPANSIVVLDGSVDLDKTLELVGEKYLDKLDRGSKIAPPAMQRPVDGKTAKVEYELGAGEQAEGRYRIAWGRVVGSYDEREKLTALGVLRVALSGSNQSLLNKRVIESGLAEDLIFNVCDGVAQPYVKIEAQNVREENLEAVEKLVFDLLTELAEKGIEHEALEAAMACIEYQMRERDYGTMPQGLVLGFNILDSMLYGGDPIAELEVGGLFDGLKKKMNEGYFERLLTECIIDNPHRARVIMIPSATLGTERRTKEAERVKAESSGWSDEERERVLAKQERLLQWQNSADTPELLGTLPRITLNDISAEPQPLPTEESGFDGVKLLYHDVNCNGIVNFTLYFNADELSEEEISQLSFVTDVIRQMPTDLHSVEQLDLLRRRYLGSLNFSVSTYAVKGCTDACRIKLAVSFGVLEKNVDKALELVAEHLCNVRFDDKDAAVNTLKQMKTQYYQYVTMNGSSVGINRVLAQKTAAAVVNDCAGSYAYYRWLSARNNDADWGALSGKLAALLKRLVSADRLTVSMTGGSRELLISSSHWLAERFGGSGKRVQKASVVKPRGARREGIAVASDITFACAGGKAFAPEAFNGSMRVASRIVSLEYLWNMIRVQGGAYGTGFAISNSGIAYCYSYRDPDAARSLSVYKKIPAFLERFAGTSPDLSGYIIGAVSDVFPAMTPRLVGVRADSNYWSGITDADRKQMLCEMLGTTCESFGDYAKAVASALEEGGVCVVGCKDSLDACELDVIETL